MMIVLINCVMISILYKCLSGEWYDCHAPVFIEFKRKTHRLLLKYNALPYECRDERRTVLEEMLGSIGKKVSVGSPFVCDYGCNIHIGNNVSINTGCTLVDCNKITIGNNVLIAPNVQIYTNIYKYIQIYTNIYGNTSHRIERTSDTHKNA